VLLRNIQRKPALKERKEQKEGKEQKETHIKIITKIKARYRVGFALGGSNPSPGVFFSLVL